MSTVKISELTALTSADAADELVIVDDSAGVTKKITHANLANFGTRTVTAGALALGTGTVTAGAIDFSGTSNLAGMTSELLDDYEEGSYTPAFQNGTFGYSKQTGKYTKIGNLVHVDFFIVWSSKSGSGVVNVNLPFSFSDASNIRYNGQIGYMNGVDTQNDQVIWHSGASGTVTLFMTNDNAASVASDVSNMSASGELSGHITYRAA